MVSRGKLTDIEIITEPDSLKVKGIIGASKLVICSRFHGCVSALSQAVPCLGTSWSHKYERLFEEYAQQDALLVADVSAQGLRQKIQAMLNTPLTVEQQQRVATPKKHSEQLWQTVTVVIGTMLSK